MTVLRNVGPCGDEVEAPEQPIRHRFTGPLTELADFADEIERAGEQPELHPENDPVLLRLELDAARAEIERLRARHAAVLEVMRHEQALATVSQRIMLDRLSARVRAL